MTKLLIILLVFLLGLYFVTNYNTVESFDTLSNKTSYRCPNVLIQKGSAFFLFNTKLAKIPGVNPLRFSSLRIGNEVRELDVRFYMCKNRMMRKEIKCIRPAQARRICKAVSQI